MKVIFNGEDYEKQIKAKAINEIIKTVEDELNKSSSTVYICKDNYEINTDVGYVAEWFKEYVKHNKLK